MLVASLRQAYYGVVAGRTCRWSCAGVRVVRLRARCGHARAREWAVGLDFYAIRVRGPKP
jgi:hypothetical protein